MNDDQVVDDRNGESPVHVEPHDVRLPYLSVLLHLAEDDLGSGGAGSRLRRDARLLPQNRNVQLTVEHHDGHVPFLWGEKGVTRRRFRFNYLGLNGMDIISEAQKEVRGNVVIINFEVGRRSERGFREEDEDA